MRNVCLLILAALVFLTIGTTVSFDRAAKEEYELQERCGKSAAKAFEADRYWNPRIPEVYCCHYSRKLNKCFIMITATSAESEVRYIYDVNENKRYGGYTRWFDGHISCEVEGKACDSQLEWDSMIKPYMEQ